ncbi:hypothetical protein GQ55_5G419400 [Panicum hallii var. hallii]|uniref:Uncharacterized protein n=1 Tax=Panicum hallii var. hallii TaxID=1504633 RepID=A0A2T7DNY5_9POAL|nr:hypothetical protein GQ55_5G419400 [Panicum hallii var. hallii]
MAEGERGRPTRGLGGGGGAFCNAPLARATQGQWCGCAGKRILFWSSPQQPSSQAALGETIVVESASDPLRLPSRIQWLGGAHPLPCDEAASPWTRYWCKGTALDAVRALLILCKQSSLRPPNLKVEITLRWVAKLVIHQCEVQALSDPYQCSWKSCANSAA